MDCSPPGSSVHGILQARILEWVAISYFRGSSQPKDWTCIFVSPALAGKLLTTSATWEADLKGFVGGKKGFKVKVKKKLPYHLENVLTFKIKWMLSRHSRQDASKIVFCCEHLLCCLVIKSCPTFCDPMDCSMPSSSVLHYSPDTHIPLLLKLMSIELMMLSNHLILCHLLLLLPSVFPSIRVFSNESVLRIR